jgi:hypothetical protein
MKKPEWEKWYIREVSISHAVLLVLDVDPSEKEYLFSDEFKYRATSEDRKIREYYFELADMALEAAYTNGSGLSVIKEVGHWSTTVDICEFANWFKSIGCKLQSDFPAYKPPERTITADDDSEEAGLKDALKVIAVLLKILKADCKKNQSSIAMEITGDAAKYKIDGIGRRKLDGIFSSANKELKG